VHPTGGDPGHVTATQQALLFPGAFFFVFPRGEAVGEVLQGIALNSKGRTTECWGRMIHDGTNQEEEA